MKDISLMSISRSRMALGRCIERDNKLAIQCDELGYEDEGDYWRKDARELEEALAELAELHLGEVAA
jgi:hypothetical protein